MKPVRRLWEIDKALGSLALIFMVVAVTTQILLRALATVVEVPVIDTLELAQYLLIAVVFFSASYVTRKEEHIAMMELRRRLSQRTQLLTDITITCLAIGVFALAFYSALLTIIMNYHTATPTLRIPFPLFFFPTAFGCLLLTVEHILKLIRLIQRKRNC